MRDIRASVEVRALVGADSVRELRGKGFARYECCQCGRGGRTAEPTSVIVLAHRAFRVVTLAHAACAGSHIIEVDAAAMRTLAGLTTAPPLGRGSGAAASPRRRPPAKDVPGMKTTPIARRLGLDGNPLRRRLRRQVIR